MRFHLLVSQLHLSHHHLHNVPVSFVLHLLSVFGYVANADAGNLPHVLGRELKPVRGTAAKGQTKVTTSDSVCARFDSDKFSGLPDKFFLLCVSWDSLS